MNNIMKNKLCKIKKDNHINFIEQSKIILLDNIYSITSEILLEEQKEVVENIIEEKKEVVENIIEEKEVVENIIEEKKEVLENIIEEKEVVENIIEEKKEVVEKIIEEIEVYEAYSDYYTSDEEYNNSTKNKKELKPSVINKTNVVNKPITTQIQQKNIMNNMNIMKRNKSR